MSIIDDATITKDQLNSLRQELRSTRKKALTWLTDRIGDDGRPEGAELGNAWWRAPWALVVGGAPDVAAAMLGWIEREALTDEADLRPGPFGGDGPGTPVYHLSPLAIASWLLGRYSTANAVMDRLEHWTDQNTGGAYENQDFAANPIQDTLKTCQLGVSALVTGRTQVSEGVYRWLQASWSGQPDLPNKLYTSMANGSVVTSFSDTEKLMRVVDFRKPRQLYYHPGIAGAFLAGHAQQTGNREALALGNDYLALNKVGTSEQFYDRPSSQICKFGWGAAAMHVAAPETNQLPWVTKMGEWFIDRQFPEGYWAPSPFLSPHEPGLLDHFWKTSEHIMEVSYIEQAIAASL
ncbi:hypothetical protein ACFVTE_16865 [Arthrobacter sp. NPDC058097]|uniref:hypothetical protein n=1 Tax=Arthrobacter sp. NPDC058097 TaxID=3346340 RepID=UPI0036DB3DAF